MNEFEPAEGEGEAAIDPNPDEVGLPKLKTGGLVPDPKAGASFPGVSAGFESSPKVDLVVVVLSSGLLLTSSSFGVFERAANPDDPNVEPKTGAPVPEPKRG